MARSVAFVIPVLNEAATIEAFLAQLRRQMPQAEIVVVDGGSEDSTASVAELLSDRFLCGSRGRAQQMNLGASAVDAQYLFFLHADTRLTLTAAQLDACLASAPAWGFSPVRLSGSAWPFRVIEWFINVRSRLTSIGTGDQLLFVRRELFEQVGGFDDIPLMEDVALCKRLRRHSGPTILPWPVVTSSRRWEKGGIARTVVLMWSLRLAYFLGVDPGRLWRYYYGR